MSIVDPKNLPNIFGNNNILGSNLSEEDKLINNLVDIVFDTLEESIEVEDINHIEEALLSILSENISDILEDKEFYISLSPHNDDGAVNNSKGLVYTIYITLVLENKILDIVLNSKKILDKFGSAAYGVYERDESLMLFDQESGVLINAEELEDFKLVFNNAFNYGYSNFKGNILAKRNTDTNSLSIATTGFIMMNTDLNDFLYSSLTLDYYANFVVLENILVLFLEYHSKDNIFIKSESVCNYYSEDINDLDFELEKNAMVKSKIPEERLFIELENSFKGLSDTEF